MLSTAIVTPKIALASGPREVWWEDLIPDGVPYSQIIGEGDIDYVNDTWVPIYDANATKLNEDLNGSFMRMPGYIVPLEFNDEGVVEFLLVPYVGACVHVPPPPANQLVFVRTSTPWPEDKLWEAIWVTGNMRTELRTTNLGQTGYSIEAELIETYAW